METVAETGQARARGSSAELLRAYRERGDLAARERVIEAYVPLVESLARRYSRGREPLEDLVQVGAIGLIKAVDRFDPRRGTPFAAFAAPNILGEIRRHLRDKCEPIRVPRRYQEGSVRLRSVQRQLAARLHRNPTTAELAAAAEVEASELDETLRAEHARSPVSLADAAPSLTVEDVFQPSEDRLSVARSMRSLHRRERHALRCRYYADMSQDEIAGSLGISQSQTSRLIASGLTKLRVELEGKPRLASPRAIDSGHGDSRRRRGDPARGRCVKAPPAILHS